MFLSIKTLSLVCSVLYACVSENKNVVTCVFLFKTFYYALNNVKHCNVIVDYIIIGRLGRAATWCFNSFKNNSVFLVDIPLNLRLIKSEKFCNVETSLTTSMLFYCLCNVKGKYTQ